MISSVDGRIDCDMTEQIESGNEYYEALSQLDCKSMLMGRVTMQKHYALPEPFIATSKDAIGKENFHIAHKCDSYCIGVDTKGILRWGENQFDGQHLIVITSEDCPKDYTDTLINQGISWIATGKNSIDFNRAVCLLKEIFGITRLAVTGGGNINSAFLNAELLDEVSLMIAPGIDGRAGMTTVFDGITDKKHHPTKLNLIEIKRLGDTVWMRYKL